MHRRFPPQRIFTRSSRSLAVRVKVLLTCSGLVEWLSCGLSVPPRPCAGVFRKSKFSKLLSRRVVPGTSTHARTSSGFSISVLTISEGFGLRCGSWCQHFRSSEALWKKKYLFWIPRRVNFVTFEFSNFLSIATFEGRYFWLIGNIYTIGLCRSVFLQPCQIEVMRVNLNYILQQNYTNLRPGYWDDLTIHHNRIIDESSLEHDHNAMGHEGSLLGTGTCFQGPEVPLKGSKISLLGSERQGFEGSLVRT